MTSPSERLNSRWRDVLERNEAWWKEHGGAPSAIECAYCLAEQHDVCLGTTVRSFASGRVPCRCECRQ